MAEILDIITKIDFEVQDAQVKALNDVLKQQLDRMDTLISRQTKLNELRNKFKADSLKLPTESTIIPTTTPKRTPKTNNIPSENLNEYQLRRINELMFVTNKNIRQQAQEIAKTTINNKVFNQALEKELGTINALNIRLKLLQKARESAVGSQAIKRYDRLIDNTKSQIKNPTGIQISAKPQSAFSKNIGAIAGGVGAVSTALPLIGGALALGGLSASILDVTKRFESYNATLKNAYQSSTQAQATFNKIRDFAEKTPFSVDELTASFIKLKNRGFDPTKEELTQIGDLASSQGKSFDQLVEAILDAQTGEFERLKEFGVKAKTTGDTVTLAFRGIEKQVKKTDEEGLRNAIISMGKMIGIAGSMEAQSQTLNGKLSNMGDAFDNLFNTIGGGTTGVLGDFVQGITSIVNATTEWLKLNPAEQLREQQTEINNYLTALVSLNDNEQARSVIISELTAKYPEFVKGLNLEKLSSEELLGVINGINAGYERRIILAEQTYRKEQNQKALNESVKNLVDAEKDKRFLDALKDTGFLEEYKKAFGDRKKQLEILKKARKKEAEQAGFSAYFFGLSNDIGFAEKQIEKEIKNQKRLQKEQEEIIKGDAKLIQQKEKRLKFLQDIEAGKIKGKKITDFGKGELFTLLQEQNQNTKNTNTKTNSDKKQSEKETKTIVETIQERNNKILQVLEYAEKKELEAVKKAFEDKRLLESENLKKQIINQAQYDDLIFRAENDKNQKLLEIEKKYIPKKLALISESEKAQSKTRLSEIKNEFNEIEKKLNERALQEIKQALDTQTELNDELLQLSDENLKKKLAQIEKEYEAKFKVITENEQKEKDLLKVAQQQKDEQEIKIREENIKKFEQQRKATTDKQTDETTNARIDNAIQTNEKDTQNKFDAIDLFSDDLRNQLTEQYLAKQEAITSELELLKNSKITEEQIEQEGGLKKQKLLKEQKRQEEEIIRKSEQAKRFIELNALQEQLKTLETEGTKLISESEKTKNKEQINQVKIGIQNVQSEIKTGFETEKEIKSQQKLQVINDFNETYLQPANQIAEAGETIIQSFEQQANREIEIRENRVSRAKEIADRGNAEALEIEEQRLEKAQKQKEKFARQQMAINLIQQASALGLAVAQALAVPFPANLPAVATVISTASTMFAQVRQMSQPTEAFADGVVNYQGKGTGTSDSNIVRISHGESIITADATADKGNKMILEQMNKGYKFNLTEPTILPNVKIIEKTQQIEDLKLEFKELKNELSEVKQAIIEKKPSEVNIDRRGVATISEQVNFNDNLRVSL